MKKLNSSNYQSASGFTIVELLIVIVVIGILATIIIIGYYGIIQKASEASLKYDLSKAAEKIKLFQVEHGSYPVRLDNNNCPLDSNGAVDNNYCIKISLNNKIEYVSMYPNDAFSLKATNSNVISYQVADSSSLNQSLSPVTTPCPIGYIKVPGSVTYGTSDFCVMKYEAKNDGSGNAISVAAGTPYVSITQTDAFAKSATACTGCHLITEAEWMTIAQNVLSVASNWSDGAVGSGYIYSGHNDGLPKNSLAAVTDDSDGYNGTGNSAIDMTVTNGVTGKSQRRTLTLTNGEVIWDFSGNVREWTSGQISVGQPGVVGGGYIWREYSDLANAGSLAVNVTPASTGINGSASWTSANGIGQIYSSTDETVLRGMLRGGNWNNGVDAGVLGLSLFYSPSDYYTALGFRVAR